jgi:cellulose synthase/poly-beta-1,6-N-acetylglucosamine synthase-like glycosyltransferase
VLRRTALEAVGGVPTETVTEDCHASLRMQKAGWRTAYLRVPLAAGLATERLMLHIGQRMRWARGMVQIMRLENPLTSQGLNFAQRLCYFLAMFHFLFPLPRFVFLTGAARLPAVRREHHRRLAAGHPGLCGAAHHPFHRHGIAAAEERAPFLLVGNL